MRMQVLKQIMETMNNELSEKAYREIEKTIGSEQSVVGIDAKKTHIIIIHMLQQIQQKLDMMEQRLDKIEESL